MVGYSLQFLFPVFINFFISLTVKEVKLVSIKQHVLIIGPLGNCGFSMSFTDKIFILTLVSSANDDKLWFVLNTMSSKRTQNNRGATTVPLGTEPSNTETDILWCTM